MAREAELIARAVTRNLNRLGTTIRRESNSFWVLAERVANNLLNFLAIVAIMRLLGPAAYGQWAFAFSIVSVLLVTGHLGLDGLLVRKLIEQPDRARHLLGVTTTLKYAIYLPAIGATLAFFSLHADVEADERLLVYVLMIAVLAAPLTSSLVAWSNAHSLFRPVAHARILVMMVGSAAKIALIGGGFGIVSVGFAHSAMLALETAILVAVVALHGGPLPWRWRFESATAAALLTQSLYLFAATVIAILYFNADVMTMRVFRNSHEVGLYALVPQIMLASQIIPYAVTLSRFPTLIRAVADRPHFYRTIAITIRSLLVQSLLVMAGLGLFIHFAFDAVFGASYEATKPLLWIACLASPPLFLRQLTTKVFILTDEGRLLAVIEFLGLLAILGMLFLGIPQYGAYAAVVAFVSGCWLTVLLSFLLLDRGRFLFRPAG